MTSFFVFFHYFTSFDDIIPVLGYIAPMSPSGSKADYWFFTTSSTIAITTT